MIEILPYIGLVLRPFRRLRPMHGEQFGVQMIDAKALKYHSYPAYVRQSSVEQLCKLPARQYEIGNNLRWLIEKIARIVRLGNYDRKPSVFGNIDRKARCFSSYQMTCDSAVRATILQKMQSCASVTVFCLRPDPSGWIVFQPASTQRPKTFPIGNGGREGIGVLGIDGETRSPALLVSGRCRADALCEGNVLVELLQRDRNGATIAHRQQGCLAGRPPTPLLQSRWCICRNFRPIDRANSFSWTQAERFGR